MKKSKKILIIVIALIAAAIIALVATKLIKNANYKKELAEYSAKTQAEYEAKYGKILDELPENMKTEKIAPASSFAGGDGSENNPYKISNAEELVLFADTVNADSDGKSAFYEITDDIYLNDVSDFDNWSSQAPKYGWESVKDFGGSLNGNGHTIYGLFLVTITKDAMSNTAFINKAYNATVKNLNFSKGYVYAYNNAGNVGGIVGSIRESVLSNCTSDITVACRYPQSGGVGGIAGTVSLSEVENCTNNGKITNLGDGSVGGIAGYIATYSVKSCVNNGEIIGLEYCEAGGIAGLFTDSGCRSKNAELSPDNLGVQNYVRRDNAAFSNLVNNGVVSTCNGDVGGIAAAMKIETTSAQCDSFVNNGTVKYNTEESSSATSCGGIIGRMSIGDGTDVPSDAQAKAVISNWENNAELINNYTKTDGKISTIAPIGGLICRIDACKTGYIRIEKSRNSGKLPQNEPAGGIIGAIDMEDTSCAEIVECVNESDISNDSSTISGGILGGIVAETEIGISNKGTEASITISDCINNGNLKTGRNNVGGILGMHSIFYNQASENSSLEVRNCRNNGAVSAENLTYAGGIIGGFSSGYSTTSHIVKVTGNENYGNINVTVNESEDNKTYPGGCSAEGGIIGKCEFPLQFENNKNFGTLSVDGNKTYVLTNDGIGITKAA